MLAVDMVTQISIWMAGGGIKPGITHGVTDELGYLPVEGIVNIHDLQATILHLMGLDPYQFSFKYQGLRQRLIGPEGDAKIIDAILA